MSEFIKVASLSELEPGACKAIEAGGKTIALFNVDGTIYALDNTCLHRGGPLGEGTLEGDVVTCPLHMWEYNVRTGETQQIHPSRWRRTRSRSTGMTSKWICDQGRFECLSSRK